MLAEVINEIMLLRKLLESLGFSTTKYATRCILDLQKLPDYFSSGTLIISMNNECVGSCSVYLTIRNVVLFISSINTKFIPKDMIDLLILLGYEKDGDNWLEYEVEIK